ncbi:MAG: stalk domain-containing protein, partial [Peptoniphilus harei]|nr:stalk domain-containing protein [Peptoniphilus harei]
AKANAKKEIAKDKLQYLSDTERQGFEKEIEEATTIEKVNKVVEKAKAKNQENKNAKDALNKAKADAVAEIEKMEFLDPTDKADFKNQVNLAKDTSEVANIQKAAEARNADKKAEKEENDKIEKAKEALKNLEENENPSASEIQNVQSLIDQLKDGETKKGLQKSLDPIKAANELKLLKDDAIREIKNLTNIEDLKEAFIQEINEAKDKNSVNEILNRAKKQSQELTTLIAEKDKTAEKIKGLENLNEEERSGFLAELETVTSLDSLKNLCLKANKKDANKLLNSKSLEDLTEDERKAAEKKIEEAETEEAIKTIIEEAKGQATINKEAAKSLADAKEAAIKLIGADKMPELSSEERRGFEDGIKKATSPEEVKKIQAEASSINSSREKEKNLYKTKDKAEKELDNLSDLSVRDLQIFKDKISKAGSQEEVERILEEAKNQDLINKNNKIKEERERENRREESKTYFWFNSFPKHQAEAEKVKVTPKAPSFKQKEKLETKKFVYKFVIGKTKFTENNDGLNQAKELDVAPFIENGRTMLPLRAIAESIGIKVDWEKSTRTAIFTNGDLVARIQIDGNKVILSDGRLIVLDAKPKIVKGRIVLPITNVSQIFGLTNGNTNDGKKNDIEWDNETKSVIISVNK